MSNNPVPPFKILKATNPKKGQKGFYCNICKHPFKQAFLNDENEKQHKATDKHQDAIKKKKDAATTNKSVCWWLPKKSSDNSNNTNNNNNTNNTNHTNNTNNTNNINNTNEIDSDDDVLNGLVGREDDLQMANVEQSDSLSDALSDSLSVSLIRKWEGVSFLETSEISLFEDICSYLPPKDLIKLSYASTTNHESIIQYVYKEYGVMFLADLMYNNHEQINVIVFGEPDTLKELKSLIKNDLQNCIEFFDKKTREHFRCLFCIKHNDIAAKYSSNGRRGAITMDGAIARKRSIWHHLVGVHKAVQKQIDLQNKKFDDEWISIQNVLTDDDATELLKIYGWGSGMTNWIEHHSEEFFVNLHSLLIRCNICLEAYETELDDSFKTIWTDGRSISNLRHSQLTRHICCNIHDHNNKVNIPSNPNHELIEFEFKEEEIVVNASDHIELQNRIRTILWMLNEKLPPHRFKSTMRLLESQNTPHLGVSGVSDNVVHKMFHMCGVYTGAIYVQYILQYVTAMCLGCDCVKTSDDVKVCHFNLRFVSEAYPITIHFGSRQIIGTCNGAKLLETLQNLVEWRDLEDVNYVGISVGKTYYELDDEKDIKHLINVIAEMKKSGMKISFNWYEFICKLYHFVSDGGGDVYGKKIGLRGRLMKIKMDECGVELMTTHGICHKIDLIARDHFLVCELFFEIVDFITTFRSFINASEYRINWYRRECIIHCEKYLTIARKFETRWIIATYQALKAWKNNYKASVFFLEECKEQIIAKCSKEADKNRITEKISVLTNGICCVQSHMMAYAAEDLMKPVATKWQVMSESEALNVISAINDVNEIERIINIKKTNIDRESKMFPWQIAFHDENVVNHIPHGKTVNDIVYRWDKYDVGENYHYKQYSKREYATIRNNVKAMYIECCDELLDELKTYKENDQFKYWILFKNIADFTLWQLNTPNSSEAETYIRNRSKSSILDLYNTKYETFIKMGMSPCTNEEFIAAIVSAQEKCIVAIESFRIDSEVNETLVKIYQRKDVSFYDIWSIVYESIGDDPFKYVYDYFVSINPGNPFSERQGRIMNIVRNKLAQNTKMHLLDTKLHGHFNLPSDIIDPIQQTHISALVWIWRNVIRGHDIVKKGGIIKKLNLSLKLPKILAKSYHKIKRKMKKEQTKSTIWQKIQLKLSGLMKRKFKVRGLHVKKSQ